MLLTAAQSATELHGFAELEVASASGAAFSDRGVRPGGVGGQRIDAGLAAVVDGVQLQADLARAVAAARR